MPTWRRLKLNKQTNKHIDKCVKSHGEVGRSENIEGAVQRTNEVVSKFRLESQRGLLQSDTRTMMAMSPRIQTIVLPGSYNSQS